MIKAFHTVTYELSCRRKRENNPTRNGTQIEDQVQVLHKGNGLPDEGRTEEMELQSQRGRGCLT